MGNSFKEFKKQRDEFKKQRDAMMDSVTAWNFPYPAAAAEAVAKAHGKKSVKARNKKAEPVKKQALELAIKREGERIGLPTPLPKT